jgi:hypothetical protein
MSRLLLFCGFLLAALVTFRHVFMRSMPACRAAKTIERCQPCVAAVRGLGNVPLSLARVLFTCPSRAVLTSQQMAPGHVLHRLLSSHGDQCLSVLLGLLDYTACPWLGFSSCPIYTIGQQHLQLQALCCRVAQHIVEQCECGMIKKSLLKCK